MAKRVVVATDGNERSADEWRSILPENEVEELRQIFAIFDSDNDGRLISTELQNLLKAIGLRASSSSDAPALNGVHQSYDPQASLDLLNTTVSAMKSEKIDFDTFLRLLDDIHRHTDPDAEVREAFRAFDADGDGFLTPKELKAAMLNLGEKMTDEEIKEMIQVADLDKDGRVNYDEFSKVLVRLSSAT